jgi:mono/diheme cytochrome c family protein
MFVYIEIAVALVAILLMSFFVSGVPSERAYRRATAFVGALLVAVALVILTIGARSPYTHANLAAAYDARYDRTEQIVVGPQAEFADFGPNLATGNDPITRGATLFVTAGCAGCHALEGRGGAVAKPIAGVTQQLLQQKVREGTAGMPRFAAQGLTDEQVAEIGSFLRSLPPAK